MKFSNSVKGRLFSIEESWIVEIDHKLIFFELICYKDFLKFFSRIKMLIELKKDFFLNTAYIVSVEIVTNETDNFSLIVKSLPNNQGNKGIINIDFDDHKTAQKVVDKIKKALN